MTQAKQIVHDLETLGAARVVDAADVHQALEVAAAVVAQVTQYADDRVSLHAHHQLAVADLDVDDVFGQCRRDMLAKLLERFRHDVPGGWNG